MKIDNKIFDISFMNVFAKKFLIRLIIFVIISVMLIISAQSITEWACQYVVENKKLETTMEIIELVDSNIVKNKVNMYTNVHLAQLQNDLEENVFIKNTAATTYNFTDHELVARSQIIPIIKDEKALNWWKNLAMAEIGYPTISINQEMMDWINANEGNNIIIQKMYYTNFVLFPTELRAVANGKTVDEYQITTPTISQSVYESDVELQIIGNNESDYAYQEIFNFRFISNDNGDVEFSYTDLNEDSKLKITSHQFTINNTQYQLDIVYQVSFWSGAWLYVMLFELLGILTCVGFAFINTKEVLSLYR